MEDINWIFQLLGRFHPLLVHFPIGLLVIALVFELFTIGGKRQGLREGIYWMVIVGAVTAIMAAIMGWLLRNYDDYTGDLVTYHQYTGIATAVLAVITALLLRNIVNKKLTDYRLYRFGLLVTVVSLSIAGHLGASLTHGEDYLTSVLPNNQDSYDDEKTTVLLTELKGQDSLTETQQEDLNLGVRAILAHNCYQCHSENKQKGELILENKEGVFKGGESGPVIVAGKPSESEMYKRITLSPNDDDVMPKKGKVLKENEIALIKLWIQNGAYWSDKALKVFPEAQLALSKPDLPKVENQTHPVDKLMAAYFDKNDIDWPKIVDDRTFIRRSYMDIIGLLPEPNEIKDFIDDSNPDKRNVLIDQLLNDTHNYTQNWLSFWNDLLRNDYSGTGFITGGRKQITHWLYTSLEKNKRYDQMVKELVNPTEVSEGFIKGIEWRGVVNASQRTEMQAAQNIGQSLLGVNVKCASCHNSFVSNLTLEQSYGFASIFADSIMELNRCDMPIGKMAEVNFLYPELGSVEAESVKERLLLLSEVIVKPENGRLYRTITNRFWERLMGRGIIEPLDEMDNEAWNSDLLDWLASDFVDSGYDLKHLIKQIMTSKAYQLPTANYKNIAEIKNEYVFKGPILRRMSAEQFSDAVSQLIKPVYAAVAYNPKGNELPSSRIWHRELKFDRDVLPEPGKRYFRKTFTLPEKSIDSAIVLISVDHSYALYINEKKISQGTDWTKVDKLNVQKVLSKGTNTIAIEGINEGSIANPAGILFSMKIAFTDGSETILNSDTSWKSTAMDQTEDWISIGYNDSNWEKVRNYGTSNWGKLIDYTFEERNGEFARASLVEQHPFLKALGRPSRENVTTSRDEQATLLQALELTNGEFFNKVLEEGADIWLKRYSSNSEKIIDELYQKSMGREPTDQEKKIMIAVLGKQPKKEALQDLFWSTLILPEFQFIN
ncbi:DUF1553 domain-containing protein [Arenibacter sp. TNZ]|jgi:uncharacterized membrane protein/mono/diheme cytochrome c family protein|uniref:DUF1549 domain-containing protein n=1 Tax=Arenibacter TaxID=178469 RepID=UPI000CD42AB6|nr:MULTISPECIES: DUF1549 domain-containing protein [Arenibacter]MCM4170184.1 DUF1553 domain-containing protein [Arenibacter sp. TNZ]